MVWIAIVYSFFIEPQPTTTVTSYFEVTCYSCFNLMVVGDLSLLLNLIFQALPPPNRYILHLQNNPQMNWQTWALTFLESSEYSIPLSLTFKVSYKLHTSKTFADLFASKTIYLNLNTVCPLLRVITVTSIGGIRVEISIFRLVSFW